VGSFWKLYLALADNVHLGNLHSYFTDISESGESNMPMDDIAVRRS